MGAARKRKDPPARPRAADVQERSSSPLALRNPMAPTLPHLRRGRRADVETRLLKNQRPTLIAEEVAKEWQVSSRVVWKDMGLIRKRWDREDTRRAHERRGRVLRRMEGAAVALYGAGEPDTASLVDYRLGRLLGLGGNAKAVAAVAAALNPGGVTGPAVTAVPLDAFASDPEAMAALRLLRDRAFKRLPDKKVDAVVTNGNGHGG